MNEIETTVAGCQVQHDASGQGHCWRNIDAADLPEIVRMEIEEQIIDAACVTGEMIASNGLRYRWK